MNHSLIQILSGVIVFCSLIFTVFGMVKASSSVSSPWPLYFYIWAASPFLFSVVGISLKKNLNPDAILFFLTAIFMAILFPYFYHTRYFVHPYFRSSMVILVLPAFHWAGNILASILSFLIGRFLLRV